jgi:hypothetical protein
LTLDQLAQIATICALPLTIIGTLAAIVPLLRTIRTDSASNASGTPLSPEDRALGWRMLISLLATIAASTVLTFVTYGLLNFWFASQLPQSLPAYLLGIFVLLISVSGMNLAWLVYFTPYRESVKAIWLWLSAQVMAVFVVAGAFILIFALVAIFSP